jgi:THO complex subunit 1
MPFPRYSKPSTDSLLKGIANDELDVDMAMTDEEKNVLINLKASKTWRILRIASKTRLNLFDKADDGKNLKVLFEAPAETKPDDQIENGPTAEKLVEFKEKENVNTVDTSAPEEPSQQDAVIDTTEASIT